MVIEKIWCGCVVKQNIVIVVMSNGRGRHGNYLVLSYDEKNICKGPLSASSKRRQKEQRA